jgi:hypothetical protein
MAGCAVEDVTLPRMAEAADLWRLLVMNDDRGPCFPRARVRRSSLPKHLVGHASACLFWMSDEPHAVWRETLDRAGSALRCRRAGAECQAAAMLNGRCRMHGGLSTGATASALSKAGIISVDLVPLEGSQSPSGKGVEWLGWG